VSPLLSIFLAEQEEVNKQMHYAGTSRAIKQLFAKACGRGYAPPRFTGPGAFYPRSLGGFERVHAEHVKPESDVRNNTGSVAIVLSPTRDDQCWDHGPSWSQHFAFSLRRPNGSDEPISLLRDEPLSIAFGCCFAAPVPLA
jgi:hypothetical protein